MSPRRGKQRFASQRRVRGLLFAGEQDGQAALVVPEDLRGALGQILADALAAGQAL